MGRWLGLGALVVGGWAGSGEAAPPPPAPVAPQAEPAKAAVSEEEAVRRALAFLQQSKQEWGRSTAVRRTGAGWYRVEFAPSPEGRERFVLINPDTGQAELPVRR